MTDILASHWATYLYLGWLIVVVAGAMFPGKVSGEGGRSSPGPDR